MLRSLSFVSSPAVRNLSQTHRSFVSAVLLSKSWDKFAVSDLKKEARSRGLSPSGTKVALISRIQEHEKSLSSVASPSASIVNKPPEIPSVDTTKEGEAPGIPLASQHAAPTSSYLNVILPDALDDEHEPAISIPYTFDSLASSIPVESPPEQDLPKMVVIGGEETYGGASPTHHLFDDTITSESEELSSTVPRGKGGILDDLAEDMGLPHFRDMKKSISKFF
ncbi:hypothetical protein GGU11DRAFT_247692 [Lentinula aff. detonsa]|nr:hypothetical protein GGU11DRAFT_247692 [Lentinula aff. detonsa]